MVRERISVDEERRAKMRKGQLQLDLGFKWVDSQAYLLSFGSMRGSVRKTMGSPLSKTEKMILFETAPEPERGEIQIRSFPDASEDMISMISMERKREERR